jgi:hypothetical protein
LNDTDLQVFECYNYNCAYVIKVNEEKIRAQISGSSVIITGELCGNGGMIQIYDESSDHIIKADNVNITRYKKKTINLEDTWNNS